MPLYQEVWSFVANSGAKWNEVQYCVAGSLAEAAVYSAAFKLRRTNLMHPTCTWVKSRVTQVGDPTIHTLVNINAQGTWDPTGGPLNPANPNEAAVINLSSTVRSGTRRLWMRGLPESAVSFNAVTGRSYVNPEWSEKLTLFISMLGSAPQQYAIKKKKTGIGNGIVKTRILQVDGTAANGTSVLMMKDNPLLVADNMIEITRAEPKLFPGLKGPFKVLAADGTSITIQYSTAQNELIKSDKAMGAKLSYWEDAVINPSASGFNFGGSRKTKNDATGSRGARSAQKLRN